MAIRHLHSARNAEPQHPHQRETPKITLRHNLKRLKTRPRAHQHGALGPSRARPAPAPHGPAAAEPEHQPAARTPRGAARPDHRPTAAGRPPALRSAKRRRGSDRKRGRQKVSPPPPSRPRSFPRANLSVPVSSSGSGGWLRKNAPSARQGVPGAANPTEERRRGRGERGAVSPHGGTYVKTKNKVVEPTNKAAAVETGMYLVGLNLLPVLLGILWLTHH